MGHGHGRHIKRHLQRRLFGAFGVSILLTGGAMFAVFHLTRPAGPPWEETVERVQAFAASRFARVWEDPTERDLLASEVAATFDVSVALEDAASRPLGDFGGACERPDHRVQVRRGGEVVGAVGICLAPRRSSRIAFAVALVAALLVLWGMSGLLARRLVRPLRRLAEVARDIGDGKLDSRVRLGRHHEGEVGHLADAVNDMARRIEAQLADQRELLAAVSHEIRTPLGHMRILAELARESGVDPKTMDELEAEIAEIDDLVGELLASSRLDFDALGLAELSPRDLGRRALERAGVPVDALSLETEASFRGDPTLLARALANVLDNAKKHGRGVASLTISRAGDEVRFEVVDRGDGFAAEDVERVFEPFYRGEQRAGSSLGLGLSLVRRIALAHGGRAFAAPVPGGGAAVSFTVRA